MYGHLDVVKWLHSDLDDQTPESTNPITGISMHTVRQGYLDVSMWLHAHGYFPPKTTSIESEALDVIMWIGKDLEYPIHGSVATLAAQRGDLAMIKWLYAHSDLRVDESRHPYLNQWIEDHREKRMLTSVACVARAHAQLAPLEHVHTLISEFLDVSLLLSLPQAAAKTNTRLFQRVLSRLLHASKPTTDRHLLFCWLGKALTQAIESGSLEIVKLIHAAHPEPLAVRSFQFAAAFGRLEILQWLCEHRCDQICIEVPPAQVGIWTVGCCLSFQCEDVAHERNHFHVLRWLYDVGCVRNLDGAGDRAATQGDLETVTWLHTLGIPGTFTSAALDGACTNGHLEIVQFLHTNHHSSGDCGGNDGGDASVNALMLAMAHGHTHVVEYLKLHQLCTVVDPAVLTVMAAEHGQLYLLEEFSAFVDDATSRSNALEAAVANGHLHVAQWLGAQPVTGIALSVAAARGHLAVLQWVHDQDCGSWVREIPAQAALTGHLHVIQWIHEVRPELLTPLVMDCAASMGHLFIVKWLHTHTDAGCSTEAMDDAAANGELEIVQWLHEHRTEGYTETGIQHAVQNGHLEVVVWLHEQGYNVVTTTAMRVAPLDVAKWLHEAMGVSIFSNNVTRSVATGDMTYLRWIHDHSTLRVDPQLMKLVMPTKHELMVEWMRAYRPEEFPQDDDDSDY